MLAYFDCFAGISGDMTLAAMIDLGLDQGHLNDQLSTLGLKGYSIKIRRSKRRGLAGVRFEVDVESDQPARRYRAIRRIIESSRLDDDPKKSALRIFETLAQAEARVHGIPVEDVHFHEVGGVDSIVDVVGAAVGVHHLGISKIICSPLPLSRGFVKTLHGNIPTPAPATLEILKETPVAGVDASIELVTPTGAAIVRTLAAGFGPYPPFVPKETGYGLGASDPEEFPNALRIVLGTETEEGLGRDNVAVVECQVDDLDPRVLGDLMDVLLTNGALDVCFIPVQMKKNRPGTLVKILCEPEIRGKVSRILLTHTTTLGARVSYWERIVLPRSAEKSNTSLGVVKVKVVEWPDGHREKRPEFDDVREIGRRTGLPAREVLRRLERELNDREED